MVKEDFEIFFTNQQKQKTRHNALCRKAKRASTVLHLAISKSNRVFYPLTHCQINKQNPRYPTSVPWYLFWPQQFFSKWYSKHQNKMESDSGYFLSPTCAPAASCLTQTTQDKLRCVWLQDFNTDGAVIIVGVIGDMQIGVQMQV